LAGTWSSAPPSRVCSAETWSPALPRGVARLGLGWWAYFKESLGVSLDTAFSGARQRARPKSTIFALKSSSNTILLNLTYVCVMVVDKS
jgi:hypothetical protein